MNKLSESRLREIIAEELEAEFVSSEATQIDIEKENQKARIDDNIAEINRKIDIISNKFTLNEISLIGADLGPDIGDSIGSIGNAVYSGINKVKSGSNIKDALLDVIKEKAIDYLLEKIGLKPGTLRNLLRSFLEELSPHEAWSFMKEPDCEKFVAHSYDVLIDFGFDHFKEPLSAFMGKATSFGPLKKILSTSGSDDLFTKILSGAGVEIVSKTIQNSPEFREWFNNAILPGVCSLWDQAWDNFDLESTTLSLSDTLSKTYGLDGEGDNSGSADLFSSLGL